MVKLNTKLMIRVPKTGCWYRFTAADWQFIMESLDLTERSRDGLKLLGGDQDAMRHTLDHPKLFESLFMSQKAALVSSELFFLVVVRHTLKEIGVEELEIADYIAVVCADFGVPKSDQGSKSLPQSQGLYSLDWMQALDSAQGYERFFIHVGCANQFMVLTCLYPNFLRHRAERRGAPSVDYYEKVVMSNLDAARHHALAEEFDLRKIFGKLAEAFPPVRRAMNHTLSEYLSLGA